MPPTVGLFHGSLVLYVWVAIFSFAAAAWGLATLTVGRGVGPRWRRGAIPLGTAVPLSLLGLGLERGLLAKAGYANAWALAQHVNSARNLSLTPYDTLVVMALIQAVLMPLWALMAALFHRRRGNAPAFRVPFRSVLVAVLALAAILAPVFLRGLRAASDPPALLDLLALLPLTMAMLAVWSLAERVEPPAADAPANAREPSAPLQLDVERKWRNMGAIDGTDPIAAAPSRSVPGGGSKGWPSAAWEASGAAGAPPAALEEIAGAWTAPGKAFLVGDMPDVAEEAFTVASLLVAILSQGLRVVVVTPAEPGSAARVCGQLRAAFGRIGAWPAGELVVGADELRDSLAQHRLPSAAFMDVGDLSARGIGVLSGPRNTGGALWAANVDLVVLSHFDRGSPLAATHALFTLRRLTLTLRAAGAAWSALATGFSGAGSLSLLERALPGLTVREVPFGLRANAQVRAWLTATPFQDAPGAPWVLTAQTAVADSNLEFAIGDPLGRFDAAVQPFNRRVRLVRDVTLAGRASASELNDAWLVAAIRCLQNVPPRADGAPHDALWSVAPGPVTKFLLKNRNLTQFHSRGRLPSPRPMVGHDNALIATAHLRAALREGDGRQDVESLTSVFGRPLVDHALGAGFASSRYVLRAMAQGQAPRRVPLAPVAPVGGDDPVRDTVTDQVVRVIDANSGVELVRVDALLADTRFYPGRVFASGDQRYVVPTHANDERRREIRVNRAQGVPLTVPFLDVSIENPVIVEALRERTVGTLRYRTIGAEITAHERITGWRQTSGSAPREERYAEVSTRYRTKARLVLLPGEPPVNVLQHLARSLDAVLVALVMAADEDLEVQAFRAETVPGHGAGIAVIDRHIGGMGVIPSLDGDTLDLALQWVRAILQDCRCGHGCTDCTPAQALSSGPDKGGVLRLLGA